MIPLLTLAVFCQDQAPKPDSGAPWKVEDAHGPGQTLRYSVDHGTWISLDVQPDGQRLVFSLLGDLYVLPIAGGTAQRITSGPGYDVQPRYSPDGQWIAFASDRGGAENLWLCKPDGSEARQVSTGKNTTVNSPAWSPDGDYLLGRRRYTDVSSLGTVELWLWHVRGGDGLAVTDRKEQPDAADPIYSHDGRFLYFSARDGRYQYDRDVYEGIWQIKRYDRRTGQSVPITSESGGAAAPLLSPDGRTMAFVRRDHAQTVLDLMDLDTGRMRQLSAGLTRDNQEGFAFHGTFPGYAWMPDGKALVATADGQIWRFDAGTGARTLIPFTAAVEQTVTEAVRFPRRLGNDPVAARILRWPVETPDGHRLVFSGLGHLYAMDLPGGTPQRLTTLEDFEYAPAWSADGSLLAFTTWNDHDGGAVWTLPAAGGAPRRVSQAAAMYANPSFSPDGTRMAVLRGSGAVLRDHDLVEDLWHEIHWLDTATGEDHYVIGTANRGPNRRMPRPTFSADGKRIYYLEDKPGEPRAVPKSVLCSVQLDGTDRREHLEFAMAEEAVLSPDGRWVVFQEQHNVWLTALPRMGEKPVEISRDDCALPLVQLSDEGGDWVGWADGGRTVTWIFGPQYHRIALDDALAFLAQKAAKAAAKDKKAEPAAPAPGTPGQDAAKKDAKEPEIPVSHMVPITLQVPRARPGETVAYLHARVVTMKGDEVLQDGSIVVDGDRIASIGDAGAVHAPAGARTVDLSGKTVIPGMFDEHAHLHYSTLDILPQRPWKYLANLAYGVTSTHDPSASTEEVFAQSELVEAGLMTGPRIFSTGYILYGADDPERAVVNSLDDARRHIRRMKALGAYSVKSYMQPERQQRQWILQAAREEGMMVVPEGGGDLEMDMTMILDGHTTIEHALPMTPLYDDVVQLFARSSTSYTPTLLVAYGGPSGDNWFYQHYDVWKDQRLLRYVPQGVVDARGRVRNFMAPDEDWHHIDVAASAHKVVQAGGKVCLGGHGQLQGLGPHWEVWAFVQGGFTPLEALRVATLYPAQTQGLGADLGSLEPGKLADFMVLDRNPLEKIENTDSVALVVKNGRAYTPQELERQK